MPPRGLHIFCVLEPSTVSLRLVALDNLAGLYKVQARYAEAEPLIKRALTAFETRLGPDHPDVAIALDNLAGIYRIQGRFSEAEPLYNRALAIREKRLGPDTKLIGEREAFANSYNVFQLSSRSAASQAINKLAQRYATGSNELATLVRKDQDLTVENDRLDKILIVALSKNSRERSQTAEDQIRKRVIQIQSERGELIKDLQQQFPDYVALSRPQPLTLTETQSLLAEDEAIVAFDVGDKNSYAWVSTILEVCMQTKTI